MSSFPQHETVPRGPDSVIDLYLNSLYILKEKVGDLLQSYRDTINQKMDCDLGNIVTCNTDKFQSKLADVFTLLNEVELQLNGLEAWSGLSPEGFSSAQAVSPSLLPDVDQASSEAQALVELAHRIKVTLRSLISKPTNSISDTSVPSTVGLSRDNPVTSKRPQVQPLTGNTPSVTSSSTCAPSEMEPVRNMELTVNPSEYGSQTTGSDELSSTSHSQRYAYNSPGSIPPGFMPSHSPATGIEKRFPDSTDLNRATFRVNQPGPYATGPGTNYTAMSSGSNPSPGVPGSYLSAELHPQTLLPPSKSTYTDPGAGPASRPTYPAYPAPNTNPDPFGGPYN